MQLFFFFRSFCFVYSSGGVVDWGNEQQCGGRGGSRQSGERVMSVLSVIAAHAHEKACGRVGGVGAGGCCFSLVDLKYVCCWLINSCFFFPTFYRIVFPPAPSV